MRQNKARKTQSAKYRRLLRKVWIPVAGVVLAIAIGLVIFTLLPTNMITLPKAAIIDQHFSLQPNPGFIEQVTRQLEDFGFSVDLYQGENVTVKLFRNLPRSKYELIIFRVHSGLRLDQDNINYGTWLFTNEPYSEIQHVHYQHAELLAKGKIDEGYPWVFAIGSKFVIQSMKGKFDNAVIVMMGCGPMYIDDMAQAWNLKGASVSIGWDERTSLHYCDGATVELISKLLSQEMTINQAVVSVMSEIGPGPAYNAQLKYFPLESGNKSIRQLLGWRASKSD